MSSGKRHGWLLVAAAVMVLTGCSGTNAITVVTDGPGIGEAEGDPCTTSGIEFEIYNEADTLIAKGQTDAGVTVDGTTGLCKSVGEAEVPKATFYKIVLPTIDAEPSTTVSHDDLSASDFRVQINRAP